jgi:ligand-binding sensor domain-containing protein
MRLLIILLFCAVASRAADKIAITEKELTLPPYRQFTLREGLPQMQVISMLQDSRGYIWIGTKKGLACFNGEKFISFTTRDGLADDYIHDLTEDYAGNIWISTSLGLSSFDGNKIISYTLSEPNSYKISPAPDGRIWMLANERKREMVFGFLENGKYFPQEQNLPEVIAPTRQNDLIYANREKSVLITKYPHIYEYREGKPKIIFTAQDTLIAITTNKGKAFFAHLKDRRNMDILEYKSGQLARVARVVNERLTGKTLLADTLHFSPDYPGFTIYTITPDTFFTTELNDIQKNQFLYDRDGQLWIGSEEGVFQLHSGAFTTFKKEYLPQVWSINEDHTGKYWFASFHFGLKEFDGTTLRSYPELLETKKANFYYFHPSMGRDGTLYFPNSYGILVKSGNTFQSTGTHPPYLTTFFDKERDLLWAGSMKKAEVFDAKHQLVRSIGEKEGLATLRYVLSINKDAAGYYWLGSTGCLSKYNWESGKITNYTTENGRLPAEKILTIFNDPQHRTWFGSSDGLLWYDAQKDSIFRLESEELRDAVNLLAAIDSSWLLVSQPAGIYLMDLQAYHKKQEVRLHLFNSANGYMGIEPGQDGAYTDFKGNIWITSGSEVVKLNPRKLKLSSNSLKVRISKCNGESLPYKVTRFSLPVNNQTAIVEFDAICFNRPYPVQYAWKTNGNDWSPWQESNYAVLTGLSHGNCEVQARARVPGLPLPEYATASLILRINLALWKQNWFFPSLFGLFALMALVTLLLFLRTRIRMSEANRQAKISQMQAIQSQMNPHFIFNAMASLQSMILSVNMEKANEYLVKLSALIRGFLEASVSTGIQGNRTNEKMEISLAEELATLENYISFQQLIYPGRFDYHLAIDPGINPPAQTIPPMLLQPFVENAIRHGLLPKKGKGILQIHISPVPGNGIRVEITDDGIGMEKASSAIRESPFRFVSRGRELTLKRIQLMNETGYHILLNTSSSGLGTKITLEINQHGK